MKNILISIPYLGEYPQSGAHRAFFSLASALQKNDNQVTLVGTQRTIAHTAQGVIWRTCDLPVEIPEGVNVQFIKPASGGNASLNMLAEKAIQYQMASELRGLDAPFLRYKANKYVKRWTTALGPGCDARQANYLRTQKWDLIITGWLPFINIQFAHDIAKEQKCHFAVMPLAHWADAIHRSVHMIDMVRAADSVLLMTKAEFPLPVLEGFNRFVELGSFAKSPSFQQPFIRNPGINRGDKVYH